MLKIEDCFIGYVNLEHRNDRLVHIQSELDRVGIIAERIEGILTTTNKWNIFPYEKMFNRTRGAIGCMLSQMSIMQRGLETNKSVIVLEDDVVFCSDIKKRFSIIEDFLNNETDDWDVFWLGGTYHKEPTWHTNPHPKDLPICDCTLGIDYEKTENKFIVRTYGCFSTHAYIVNINSIEKVLSMLNDNMHEAMGIDHLFIALQPKLKTFAFSCGCAKQIDNQSDIGNGVTRFSGFKKLGEHWFQDDMNNYNF